MSTSVFNDSQPLFQSFRASVVQLVLCRESRSFGLEVPSACFSCRQFLSLFISTFQVVSDFCSGFIQQLATASSLGYCFDSQFFPVCLPKSFFIHLLSSWGKSCNSACQQHIRNQGGFVCLLCVVSPGFCSAFTGFYSALPICNYVFSMWLIKRGLIPRLFQVTFTCS